MNQKMLPALPSKKPMFTPGPWRLSPPTCRYRSVVADSSDGIPQHPKYEKSAYEEYGGYLIGESIMPGNAALIAIAPEMYSYLNMLKQYAPDGAQEEIEKLLTRAHI